MRNLLSYLLQSFDSILCKSFHAHYPVHLLQRSLSITVIETVSATGRTIPPIVIIQGQHHMESWFRDRLHQNELVLLSDSGFTNDQLAIRFLEHFILYSDASPSQPTKLLLMDNHGSHVTPEFINLATCNNVVPFTFPAHLTHCMQPCDVGIFQAMKHWHNKAIQHALVA